MRSMGIMSMILMLAVMVVPCAIIKSGLVKIEKGKISLSDPGDSWASKKVHNMAEQVINLLPKEGVNALTGRSEDDVLKQLNGTVEGVKLAHPAASHAVKVVKQPMDFDSEPEPEMPIIKVTSSSDDSD